MRFRRLIAGLGTAVCVTGGLSALTLTQIGAVARPLREPAGLSGLTFVSGDLYYAVNDQDGRLYPITIAVDRTSGAITNCQVGAGVTFAGARDLEGCAFDAASGCVWASDESGATIIEFDLADGSRRRTTPVPSVFLSPNCRDNFSFEALTLRGDGREMWTANEEALQSDGPLASAKTGSVVRLLRFMRPTVDADWKAAGQFAYLTRPIGRLGGVRPDVARSGVSGLCCLPDGTLLVLERAYKGGLAFFISIYAVDFTDATDVSDRASLTTGNFKKVVKRKLLSGLNTGFAMYEGICLGPRLEDGSFVVLLISDSGSTASAGGFVMSLKLSGFN